MSHAFVCTSDPEVYAAHRHPTFHEGLAIAEYTGAYKKAVGYEPHGWHIIPLPGHAATVAVYFPMPEPQ